MVMNMPLLNLELRLEVDIVLARQRARQIAALLGFAQLDQTRIATATSEIARNAVQYAGGGRVEFCRRVRRPAPALSIRVRERGPGIRDLQAILDGQYVSHDRHGDWDQRRQAADGSIRDRIGARGRGHRLDGEEPAPPSHRPHAAGTGAGSRPTWPGMRPQGLLEELQQQNQELLNTLQELRERQAEIAQMHSRELDETNRGVVALYAELDEGAKALQRLSDLKSRFLSEMSHEFRSPLNSIKGLTGFLLARSDGDLTAEQEKQVKFIRQAADGLSTLVDDLLDLAQSRGGQGRDSNRVASRSASFSRASRERSGP